MNIPFELIFIVLFFVLPALGSLQKRLRERGQTEDAEQPHTDRDRPQPSAETTIETTDSTTDRPARPLAAPTRADTTGPDWLEEAQRRVREAQEAESDRRGRRKVNPRTRPQTSQPPTPPRPARAPRPTPQAARPAQTRPDTPSLEGRTLEGGSLESYRPAYSSLEVSGGADAGRALKTAPPLNVQRLGGGKRATMAQAVRLDEQSVMNGFIWHQVLSPPLSKSRRTRLSRRQP